MMPLYSTLKMLCKVVVLKFSKLKKSSNLRAGPFYSSAFTPGRLCQAVMVLCSSAIPLQHSSNQFPVFSSASQAFLSLWKYPNCVPQGAAMIPAGLENLLCWVMTSGCILLPCIITVKCATSAVCLWLISSHFLFFLCI